jgi:hypothetical protein
MGPCYKCTERFIGCHGVCELYIESVNKKQERTLAIRTARNKQNIARLVAIDQCRKAKRKRERNE